MGVPGLEYRRSPGSKGDLEPLNRGHTLFHYMQAVCYQGPTFMVYETSLMLYRDILVALHNQSDVMQVILLPFILSMTYTIRWRHIFCNLFNTEQSLNTRENTHPV